MVDADVLPKLTTGLEWKIRNWTFVQRHTDLINNQKLIFESGELSDIKSKWMISLKYVASDDKLWVVWKLLKVDCQKIQALVITAIPDLVAGFRYKSCERHSTFDLNDKSECEVLLGSVRNGDMQYAVDTEDSLIILIHLTTFDSIVHPEIPSKMETFSKKFMATLYKSQPALLNDNNGSADLKIITSDGQQLIAHRHILEEQCPYFGAMLRSELSQAYCGILNLKNVTGKTMGIILHYFYTAELLQSWSDEDTIVEFTYAAGKFRLTGILKMLDKILGTTGNADVSPSDIHLLGLARKLSLKNAERNLLKRLDKFTANKVQGGAQFDNKSKGNI